MSYLKFDKSLMINLEQSLSKEMIRTNRSGAYHCTTIVEIGRASWRERV